MEYLMARTLKTPNEKVSISVVFDLETNDIISEFNDIYGIRDFMMNPEHPENQLIIITQKNDIVVWNYIQDQELSRIKVKGYVYFCKSDEPIGVYLYTSRSILKLANINTLITLFTNRNFTLICDCIYDNHKFIIKCKSNRLNKDVMVIVSEKGRIENTINRSETYTFFRNSNIYQEDKTLGKYFKLDLANNNKIEVNAKNLYSITDNSFIVCSINSEFLIIKNLIDFSEFKIQLEKKDIDNLKLFDKVIVLQYSKGEIACYTLSGEKIFTSDKKLRYQGFLIIDDKLIMHTIDNYQIIVSYTSSLVKQFKLINSIMTNHVRRYLLVKNSVIVFQTERKLKFFHYNIGNTETSKSEFDEGIKLLIHYEEKYI